MAYQPPSPVTGPDFLQQFMAGWQMGMQRKEAQRRDQILAQQAEQDRLDRQMRQEYLKIQQQELKAKMARTKFEDALESVKLRQQAAMQPQTPAMASDVGIQQTTPADVGPPMSQIAVPQPTQAIPDPSGGADIQMPILTGPQMQAEAQAAQQAKMREALGIFGAQEKIKAMYRAPEKTLEQIQAEAAARARGTASVKPAGGGGGGLSPAAEATIIGRLTKDWQTVSQNSREMARQLGVMESGLAAAKRGDLAAGSQAVLVTFQKVLDPTSVVRESEYARSAAGQALMARIQGAAEQLQKGGAGVPVAELEKFASLAREFTSKSQASIQATKERIGKTADRYKIPRDVIFEEDASATGAGNPQPTHRWSPQGGIVPIGGR